MTHDDVIELWREHREVHAFARAVEAIAKTREREACAKVCEGFYQGLPPNLIVRGYLENMAKSIRARGNL
jgi:hypothetical protein